MNPWLLGILFTGLLLGSLYGCNDPKKNGNGNQGVTYLWEDYESKVQRGVFDLVTSETPLSTAERLRIDAYSFVKVEISLSEGTSLPAGFYILEKLQVEDTVQAWVRVDQLLELSKRPEIRYIRSPIRPVSK